MLRKSGTCFMFTSPFFKLLKSTGKLCWQYLVLLVLHISPSLINDIQMFITDSEYDRTKEKSIHATLPKRHDTTKLNHSKEVNKMIFITNNEATKVLKPGKQPLNLPSLFESS